MSGTFTDGQMVFSAGSSSSDSTSLQLETSTTVSIRVPAGNPTRSTSGEHSGDAFNGSTSDGSELLSVVSAGSDSLVTRDGIGEDGELLSSGEGGQDGEKSSRRRDHVGVVLLFLGYPPP